MAIRVDYSTFVHIFSKAAIISYKVKKKENESIFIIQYNAAFSLPEDYNLPVLMGALRSR